MQENNILCYLSRQTKLIGTLGLIFSLMAVSLFSLVSPVYAAGTIDVNATADAFAGGTCSLRNAIESANTDTNFGGCTRTGTPPYTINVPAGTYILTIAGQNEDVNATGDLDIRAAMDIVGAGSGTTLLQGTPSVPIPLPVDRILHIVNPVTVNISGVTVRYGLTEVDGNGGGISNSGGGSLHLTNSLIAANGAQGDSPGQGGGGLYNVVTGTLTLSNTNVISNGAIIGSGNGGGILNAGTLQITGGSIAENRANRAGGGVENNGGTATFTNLAMTSNTVGSAPGNGGALHTSGAGVVTMNGCSVLSNTAAAEGGGLWNSAGGTMTVNNVTMSGNIASGAIAAPAPDGQGGGALFNDGGKMTVSNSTITNNKADGNAGSGGGIFNNNGSLTITGGTIASNSASRAGGGIESAAGTTTLNNLTLMSNTTAITPGNGGAFHITGVGTATVTGGSVISNTAAAEGGGLWNGSGRMTVNNVTLSGNKASGAGADQGGGGLFNNVGGTLNVSNSTISGNTADGAAGSGGGILNDQGTLNVSGGTIANNTSNRAGGGIEANIGQQTLTNVNLSGNSTGSAPGNGGGFHITGAGVVTMTGSSVISNTASAEGGGLWNSSGGKLTVDKTTVNGNVVTGSAAEGGGGLFNDGGTLNVSNSTVSGNTAQPSGGGLSNKGTATIINVTVYENSSVGGTGGISNTGTLNLSNSIVAHKTATGVDCSGVNAGAFNLASDSSCQAAIVGDPLLGPLQLNGGSTKTHAPGNGSPALDVGNNAVCAAPPINNVDQRGVKRPFGSTCDLGAQEDGSGTYIYLPLVFK